jgi:hypothetical protein
MRSIKMPVVRGVRRGEERGQVGVGNLGQEERRPRLGGSPTSLFLDRGTRLSSLH